MKILNPIYVDNVNSLKLMKRNSVICRPYVLKILKAYRKYYEKQAHPYSLVPLRLPQNVVDELYSYYKAERKRDGLQWISGYRSARNLSHCPLCGNPGPSQLEHYLPRSPYAEFTTFSWNLVPSCGLCNGKRGNKGNPPGQAIPLIHPYFDEAIFSQPMLSARIVRPLGGITFSPIAVGPFAPAILERIQRQIDLCINVDRFNAYLEPKWNIWRGKASEYGGVERVREELQRELRASVGPTGKNSWDIAFLRAVLADEEALQWLTANAISIAYIPFSLSKIGK